MVTITEAKPQHLFVVNGIFKRQDSFTGIRLFNDIQSLSRNFMIACYRNDDVIDVFLDLGSRDADFLFLGKGQNAYALNMRKEVQLHSQ